MEKVGKKYTPKISKEARAARAPLPPEILANALQDRIHCTSGPLRTAKSIKCMTIVNRVLRELETSQEKAVDVVYDELDPLLLAGKFEEARAIIRDISQHSFPLAILLSALIVSYPWRDVLGDDRIKLSSKAKQIAFDMGGDGKVNEIYRFL